MDKIRRVGKNYYVRKEGGVDCTGCIFRVKSSTTFRCELVLAKHDPLCFDFHTGVGYVYIPK